MSANQLPLDDAPAAALVSVERMLSQAHLIDGGHYDELCESDGVVRPSWRDFWSHLGAPLPDLSRRQHLLTQQIQEDGVTYNVYNASGGPSRPWSLEVLPMIVSASDWQALERGVMQRATLLERVLHDVYGEQRVLHEALLPAALVQGHPGYIRGLQGVRPIGGVYLHMLAFDLVRGPDGAWWVAAQRTQAPSGLGYVMQNRLIVSRLFPDAYRAMNVQHLASSYRQLVDTMAALAAQCAGGEPPRLALWTPGPYNETYFEQAYLARYLGLPLVEGGDLIVRDEHLFLKTVQGLEPIHGLLRRLDDDYCDPLELRVDSTLGVPGLMQVVRAGNVVLANALGTGFLESPAVHGFLPALSESMLGEPLQLPSAPTWWCGEAAAWEAVKPTLAQQLVRPTYPCRPGPECETLYGPTLSAPGLKTLEARISQNPSAFTAQNYVPYAQTPVWTDDQLQMRGASLRVYALSDGHGGWRVVPGGMTRIATRDAGPVSMQLGGSSLDTWVLTEGAVDAFSMLPQSVRLEELAQRQRPVSSRTAENLFWMGRYTERCEQQLRLAQALINLRAIDDEPDEAVLRALSALGITNGLVPPGTPGLDRSGRVFERVALEALTDADAKQGAFSLAFNLSALSRSAEALRERLLPSQTRLMRTMVADFQSLASAAEQEDAVPISARSGEVMAALDHLAIQLSAVTGAQTDRMTRDAGWRLMSVGRMVERLVGYASFLRAFWREGAFQHPQGFDVVLDLFDSTITFRARFQRRLEVPAMLALLVLDETNPRSLACVVRRMRTELGKLPARTGAQDDLQAWLPYEGLGVTLEELCHPETGRKAVQSLLDRLVEAGWKLSDEIGRQYFAHAEPNDSMVST